MHIRTVQNPPDREGGLCLHCYLNECCDIHLQSFEGAEAVAAAAVALRLHEAATRWCVKWPSASGPLRTRGQAAAGFSTVPVLLC